MEKQIKIAAKLYECRDIAKMIYKNEYKEEIQPYIDALKKIMKAKDLQVIPALLLISKTDLYQGSGMTQLMFMAAVVEILEPSN